MNRYDIQYCFFDNNLQGFGLNKTCRQAEKVTCQVMHPGEIQNNHELIKLNFTITATV